MVPRPGGVEVGVIGDVGGEPAAVLGQEVAHVPAFAPVVFERDGLVVDLDRVSRVQR